MADDVRALRGWLSDEEIAACTSGSTEGERLDAAIHREAILMQVFDDVWVLMPYDRLRSQPVVPGRVVASARGDSTKMVVTTYTTDMFPTVTMTLRTCDVPPDTPPREGCMWPAALAAEPEAPKAKGAK